jgi:DNA-binding MarR family transcriptional regulator
VKNELHNELLRSLFKLKKITLTFRPATLSEEDEMSLSSLSLLHQIQKGKGNLSGEKIRKELSITKPAVSQMLASLESKDLITRETNKENRRCIVLSLTEKRAEFIENTQQETEKQLSGIIERFGENETRELISLINRFSIIAGDPG